MRTLEPVLRDLPRVRLIPGVTPLHPLQRILRDAGLAPLFPTEGDVELSCREKEGICTYFAINFGRERACVDLADKSYTELLTGRELTGNTPIEPGDVLVFGRKSNSEGKEA